MKGLEIKIKKLKPGKDNSFLTVLFFILFLLLILCMVPVILLVVCCLYIYRIFSPEKQVNQNEWISIYTYTDFIIKYKWLEDIPDFIVQYFDNRPVMIFDTHPKNDFFDGYFTEFKIERGDGIFVQKIITDNDAGKITELPLYFFDFASLEYEIIKDLFGYEINCKGGPSDFAIEAVGAHDVIEIRIKKEYI